VRDFSHCNARLWADKLGQISLATTTLLWGVFGNLRLIVFAWAAAALGYSTTQASPGRRGDHRLGDRRGGGVDDDEAGPRHRVIPLAIVVGVLMIGLNVITNVWVAVPFLVVLGALCGYLIVPMNALLQHRGHNLMGAGRSIAVQNFNEQACILGLGALYTGMTKFGLSAFVAIAVLRAAGGGTMELIRAGTSATGAAPRRSRAAAGHRPHRRALSAWARKAGSGTAGLAWCRLLALLFNAFTWGVSWWPFRQLQALGLHPLWATVLIYALAVVAICCCASGRRWRAAARTRRCGCWCWPRAPPTPASTGA
jgi:hypothetical protein